MALFNRLKAFMVRFFLCMHFALVVWRVTVSWNDHYWLLNTAIIPLLLEGIYTIVKRKGLEWRLFSLCFFFYLCATLPGIWLLEIKKTMTYQDQNVTQVEDIVVSGVEIPIRLSPNTWVLVMEEMMLYLMILGRWFMPRGGAGREQLTQLLFGFVGIASDIMELFSLFDEDPGVRHSPLMTYCILGVWSLSVFQFTLTFATAHRPRRARGLRMSTDMAAPITDRGREQRVAVLKVELLATVLSMVMQDGPFLVLRLYTMVTFNVITYSLVFFTAKNVLVILLLNYKVFLLLGKLCCPKNRDDDNDDEDDDDDDDDEYKLEKNGIVIGPHVKGMTPVQHTNGRVMHPMSTMPQFVVMRSRKQDDGVKPNPLFAGHDTYGRQYIGDPLSSYIKWNGVNPHRHPVNRNVNNLQMDPVNRNEGDPQRNHVSWSIGESPNNVGGPQRNDSNQFIGDLQRAIEGPATPAKKIVRGKKSSRPVKADDIPKENALSGEDGAPKPDISIISDNDLTEDRSSDKQNETNGNGDNGPDSVEEATDEFRNDTGNSNGENPSASAQHHQQPPAPEVPVEDVFSFLADFDEDQTAEGRIPTNGAVNALVLSTVDWDEEDEGQAGVSSEGTGQGHQSAQVSSKDSVDPQLISMSAFDIEL